MRGETTVMDAGPEGVVSATPAVICHTIAATVRKLPDIPKTGSNKLFVKDY
jgi:hypothetical protein